MKLQISAFHTTAEQLQRRVDGFAETGLALVIAAFGEGAQAGGDPAHAVDQFVDGVQVGAGDVQLTAFQEAHGVAGQGPQCGQRLVQFVGDAGRHLADGRQFSGLDQFILRPAQRLFGLAAFANLRLSRSLLARRSVVRSVIRRSS